MLQPTVIFLLFFTALAHAGHRFALVIDGSDKMERALNEHDFTVARLDGADRKKIKEALHLFVQGVPTKGLALVYSHQEEPKKILERLQAETGAAASIVLTESDDFTTNLTRFLGDSKGERAAFPPHQAQPGKRPGEEWVNAYGMVFCWCPEMKGGFWMGKYEVTLREFNAVTRKNPKNMKASLPNHPRDGIHYDDITQFVRQLNQRERFFKRIPEDWVYALPSEDQWTLAARAGAPPKVIEKHANFADSSLFDTGDDFYHYAVRDQNDQHPYLAIVGSLSPNPWGIHDLFGNLWEWTRTYPDAAKDPKNPGHPTACGGSWVSLPSDCSTSSRRQFPKRTEKNFIGFRLVLQQVSNKLEK